MICIPNSKSIFISYVRAEATQYALDLKQELVSLGFSVYLDIHEIKNYCEDVSNFTVTRRYLFVPLITSMYGRTPWTNREVKLAHVSRKLIIPVNFMDTWPPPNLAVQFASTQYIPWNLEKNEYGKAEKCSDHILWDLASLKRVAAQIAECYRDNDCKLPKRNSSDKEIVKMLDKPKLSAKDDNYILSKDEFTEDSQKVLSDHREQCEAKMNYLVSFLKRNLPFQGICVYIAGSCRLQTQRAEEICKAIGNALAKVERLSLITGGFFGAADITAKTFFECRENQGIKEESVVHILPVYDSEDLTAKANQNPDGTFEAMPYGKTVFLGDSVKEREVVVARFLNTCIVIGDGSDVVHEVEEFLQNYNFVIPVMSTGGAAGGQYGVPVKTFEVPSGVDSADWSMLSEEDAAPEAVAKAIVNILLCLETSVSSPTNTRQSTAVVNHKSRKKSKSRKFKALGNQDMQETEIVSNSPDSKLSTSSVRNAFEMREASEVSHSSFDEPHSIVKTKYSWWLRFLNVLKHKS